MAAMLTWIGPMRVVGPPLLNQLDLPAEGISDAVFGQIDTHPLLKLNIGKRGIGRMIFKAAQAVESGHGAKIAGWNGGCFAG